MRTRACSSRPDSLQAPPGLEARTRSRRRRRRALPGAAQEPPHPGPRWCRRRVGSFSPSPGGRGAHGAPAPERDGLGAPSTWPPPPRSSGAGSTTRGAFPGEPASGRCGTRRRARGAGLRGWASRPQGSGAPRPPAGCGPAAGHAKGQRRAHPHAPAGRAWSATAPPGLGTLPLRTRSRGSAPEWDPRPKPRPRDLSRQPCGGRRSAGTALARWVPPDGLERAPTLSLSGAARGGAAGEFGACAVRPGARGRCSRSL